ncbi:MAG TPA: hypothetical protein VHT26_20860 [Trebonia sp.]|nr:hypothetical protein [Trebonia sp.]
MKTGIALGFICIGAILAFAVTGNTSVFNIHTAGWVIMLVGLVGLFLPRRNRAWLGRRVVVRRTRGYPNGPDGPVEEIPVPPYVARNPGTARIEAGLPARPTLLTEREQGLDDPIEEAENRATGAPQHPRRIARQGESQQTAPPQTVPPQTEIVEDLYENPE